MNIVLAIGTIVKNIFVRSRTLTIMLMIIGITVVVYSNTDEAYIEQFHVTINRVFKRIRKRNIPLLSDALKYVKRINEPPPEVISPDFSNIADYKNEAEKSSRKRILLWNPFFMKPDYGAGFGTSAFVRSRCPVTCWLTNDRSDLMAADAVVVHAFNLALQHDVIPPRTNQNQTFVFFLLESPLKSYDGLTTHGIQFNDIFNITMTYLDDPETDVRVPLGILSRRGRHKSRAVIKRSKINQKTKNVVWFVSNCYGYSARSEYVEELSKYIQVDIYGRCGNLSCHKDDARACFKQIENDYRFYLAFENSYCKDYITEKTYRTFSLNMVPVVLGGGNYKRSLPKNSVIDVRDFTSPKTLANYLLYLAAYPDAYREYFTWKGYYTAYTEQWSKTLGFCKLCQILHNTSYPYKSNFDVSRYWNPGRWCNLGDDEKRIIHLL